MSSGFAPPSRSRKLSNRDRLIGAMSCVLLSLLCVPGALAGSPGGAAPAGPAGSSPELRIAGVEWLPGNRLSLLFHQADAGQLDFRLTHQAALDVDSARSLDLQARIVELGDGFYQTVIPMPPAVPRFYRIEGFAGPDTDGDGLSDVLEQRIGTNPSTFDSDGDGFGDGVELMHGSDPLVKASAPMIIQADFAETASSAREGDGEIGLTVVFSAPYAGPLHYRIAEMSTAAAGTDFDAPAGEVAVNGTSVVIPVSLLDDTRADPVKLLAIDLVADPWGDYQLGGASRHVVMLSDNDTVWSGVMGTDTAAQLGFRLRMPQVGNQVVSAALVSEPVSGGSGGTGTIPPGEWPVQVVLGEDTFHAVSVPIPMGNSLLTGDVQLQRTITLNAASGVAGHQLISNIIVGTFTDRLQSGDPGMQWVDGTVSGEFVLMQSLPVQGGDQ